MGKFASCEYHNVFFRSVVFLVEKEDIDVSFSKYLYREKIIDHWSVAKNSLTAQDQCSS